MLGCIGRLSASCYQSRALAAPCTGQGSVQRLSWCSKPWAQNVIRVAIGPVTPLQRRSGSLTAMASAGASTATATATATAVDHVVLLKVKEGTPAEKSEALVAALRGLRALDVVLELNAGPLLKSVPSGFTHALHSRYRDKAGLDTYQVHPQHKDVVAKFVLPLSDNIIAFDWETTPVGSLPAGELGAVRIVLLKPKEGFKADDYAAVLEAVSELQASFPALVSEISSGSNFSTRAKGYEWGFLLKFRSSAALEEFSSHPTQLQLVEEKLKPLVESVLVLDLARDSEKEVAKL